MGKETERHFLTETVTHRPASSGNGKKKAFASVITITNSASVLDEVMVMTYFKTSCKMNKIYTGY